jgi:hypothetical protein
MKLGDLLRETLSVDCDDVWENERAQHPSGCSGCGSIQWGCRCGRSSRCSSGSALIVSTAQSGTGRTRFRKLRTTRRRETNRSRWREEMLYAAIDTDSKLLLEIELFSRRGTDPAAFTRAKLSLANQNAKRSDDGISPPSHRETQRLRYRVPHRCRRVSHGVGSPRAPWWAQL